MTLFNFFLIIHILGGSIGLLAGSVILFLKKGDARHKMIGRFFYWGMILAGVSSLILSQIRPNPFLFIIGVFTLYMNLTGNIYLKFKKKDVTASLFDKVIVLAMVVVAAMFVYQGLNMVSESNFGYVYLTFAFVSIRFIYADYKFYKGQLDHTNNWLQAHLQRMLGTYIAAMTAFLVVNVKFLPDYIVWLFPTVVITPLIIFWSKKYKKDLPIVSKAV
ncbi:hypothetical protein SAMN05421813_13528 [Daejeonella rubra]|uniref:DUF2306 domain-containing protein n=1 Tax=Daejeonella rubra TaxID=990371 RepID=A0A1G9Y470_9SPHI|nr:hypothetical protein [Daejeonella rubra]SDN03924.1 hypothetical protein SAMN05421813_13528 [Daejeonella rubra]